MKNIPLKNQDWSELMKLNLTGVEEINPQDLKQLQHLQETTIRLENIVEWFSQIDDGSTQGEKNFLKIWSYSETIKSIYIYFDEKYGNQLEEKKIA